jgi:RAVE protein 1 C terminal
VGGVGDEKYKYLCSWFFIQEEKNKAAALKNAYVLMGRHQLELAIAFFLLGGDASSAVSICAKNYGDEQLALVICRLQEGITGLLERDLISSVLLPSAIGKGDRWLASLFEVLFFNSAANYLLFS